MGPGRILPTTCQEPMGPGCILPTTCQEPMGPGRILPTTCKEPMGPGCILPTTYNEPMGPGPGRILPTTYNEPMGPGLGAFSPQHIMNLWALGAFSPQHIMNLWALGAFSPQHIMNQAPSIASTVIKMSTNFLYPPLSATPHHSKTICDVKSGQLWPCYLSDLDYREIMWDNAVTMEITWGDLSLVPYMIDICPWGSPAPPPAPFPPPPGFHQRRCCT